MRERGKEYSLQVVNQKHHGPIRKQLEMLEEGQTRKHDSGDCKRTRANFEQPLLNEFSLTF